MTDIPFHVPLVTGLEAEAIQRLLARGAKFSGDGPVTKRVEAELEQRFGLRRCLMTCSCTAALEIAALLLDLAPGDEVIVPSFTFVTTASAFALRGAHLKYVDIRPDTLNLDETKLEAAITSRTRAIVPVHYAGVAAEMDTILAIARAHGVSVVEDAAQGVEARYKGKALGGIGDLGCWSFHDTKNFHCGEGGTLVVNEPKFLARAEIIREKGTDRSRFLRGEVDKYSWQELGSSFLLSDLAAAFLSGQIPRFEEHTRERLANWERYRTRLAPLAARERLRLPSVPKEAEHNAHLFYVLLQNPDERSRVMQQLREQGIGTATHYVPLHSSTYGQSSGTFVGRDEHTTRLSERILRLPLHSGIGPEQVDRVCDAVEKALC